jgi:hypothetical protein
MGTSLANGFTFKPEERKLGVKPQSTHGLCRTWSADERGTRQLFLHLFL